MKSGLVEPERFREPVRGIPEAAYASYPNLGRDSVRTAVDEALEQVRS